MNAFRSIAIGTLQDFRRAWWQLVVTDLFLRIAGMVVLSPMVALLLRVFLSRWGEPAVTDTDLLNFFLRPLGLAALLVVGAVSLAILFAQAACILGIGFGVSRAQHVTWLDGLRFVGRRLLVILRLGAGLLIRTLLIALPFLAAGGLVFVALLTRYDINFYLATKPPAFILAVVLFGILTTGLSAVLVYAFLGWIFALPIALFERKGPTPAIRASRQMVKGRRWTLLAWAGAWAGVSFLAGGGVTTAVGFAGRFLIPVSSGSITLVSLGVGATMLVAGALNLVLSFVSGALLMLLVVRLYVHFADEKALVDPFASRDTSPEHARRLRLTRRVAGRSATVVAIALTAVTVHLVLSVDVLEDVAITAHRGASAAAPENTLAAVERAIEDGTDWVEIDVQETADGNIVVVHDQDLKKLAGLDLKVGAATYDQLRHVDVGSSFSPEFAEERIPKLDQVLAVCKGHVGLNIELKYYGHEQRLEERVIELVEAHGMASEIVVMSLKYEGVQKTKALRPSWTVGLLTAVAIGDLTKVEADFLAVNANLATSTFIRSAHRRGKDVYVWTINDPVQMSDFISRGVDNIITDKPALARSVLAQRAEMTPAERLLVRVGSQVGLVVTTEEVSGVDDA